MITIDKFTELKEIEAKFSKFLNNKEEPIVEEYRVPRNIIEDEVTNPFQFLLEMERYRFDKEKLKEISDKIIDGFYVIKLGIINGELQREHLKKLKIILQKSKSKFSFPGFNEAVESVIVCSEVELAKS